MTSSVTVLTVAYLSFIYQCISCLQNVNPEIVLRSALFNESTYNAQVIPRRNVTDTVQISLKWNFLRLKDLSDKEARLTQTITVELKWKDEFLVWDPSLYDGISYFTATGREVWTPEFLIYNRLESSFLSDGLQAEQVLVQNDGTILALPFGELSTICSANTELFPADCQKCSIALGSTGVSQQQMFVWDDNVATIGYDKNKDDHAFWKITNVENTSFPSFLKLEIYLKRLPAHYIYNIVFPASALSILAVLSFLIPIDEGERLSFGITIFLSFMVLMLQVSSVLPENSKSITAVGKYFLQITCSSLIVIFSSVVLSYFERKSNIDRCTCRLNSVHPKLHGGVCKNEHKIAFEEQQNCTDHITTGIKEHSDKTMDRFKMWGYRKLMRYFRPIKLFSWVTLLSCLIVTIYGHIELYMIMNDETCRISDLY
ncbi:neuronal acetylcholine receptor subunit beta-3-like [Mytilus galloprovincialis]|uniref:neuronal acetylcholine receptor subunit beta-3-like n=1 Tax=Mytilus galloprovincialis TaxID=29158 RepID=UPI003F7CA8B2